MTVSRARIHNHKRSNASLSGMFAPFEDSYVRPLHTDLRFVSHSLPPKTFPQNFYTNTVHINYKMERELEIEKLEPVEVTSVSQFHTRAAAPDGSNR
jgi:hypothetical protein